MAGKRIAIIAAMHREIKDLVQGWNPSCIGSQGLQVNLFEKEHAIVAYAGIGSVCARVAADAVYRHAKGEVSHFVSVGVAGALDPALHTGDVIQPARVIDDADSLTLPTAAGKGLLVSAGTIADAQVKSIMADKHNALAVDMEAYAVADVARIHGVPFLAIKAISDEAGFPMPPLGRFVTPAGGFRTGSFVVWTLLRPARWSTVAALGRNTSTAVAALTERLREVIRQGPESADYNGVSRP